MKFLGITGGIATGKSTVTKMLRALGAKVLDADDLAREVVAQGTPGLAEIAARWPEAVPGGVLDRKKLGELIFTSPQNRAALDAITHPRIQQLVLERTRAAAEKVVFYDAALIVENRLHEKMDGLVLVVTDPDTQLKRLMARNSLGEADARARIASQLPLEAKKKHATWIIDNSGPLEATRAQVEKLWQEVKA